MKQHAYVRLHLKLFILALAALLLLFAVNCGKNGKYQEEEVVVQLMEFLNKDVPADVKFETEVANSTVEPMGDNRYLVTLRNSTFTVDTASTLKFLLRSFDVFYRYDVPAKLDTVRIDEARLVFSPKKGLKAEYIDLEYVKGIHVDRDLSEMVTKENESGILEWLMNWNLKRGRLYIGNVTFENIDINTQLKFMKRQPPGDAKNFSKKKPQLSKITVEDIRLTFDCEENISILIKLEGIKNRAEGFTDKELFEYFIKKNTPLPDISDILAKGSPLSASSTEYGKLNISITKNGKQWFGGSLDGFLDSSSLEPDETKTRLKYSMCYGLKNLKFSFPDKKGNEVSGRVKDLSVTFSLENVNPGVLLVALELLRKSIQLRDSADEPVMRQQMLMESGKYWSEWEKSGSLNGNFSIDIESLKLSIPGKKEIELLSDIKECHIEISGENINTKTLLPVLEYFKKTKELKGSANDPKIRQDMMMQRMKIMVEMMQTKPVIKYSISPLRHYFGELSVKFEQRPPTKKASIEIKRINEVFSKLQEANLVSPFTLILFRQGLQQIAVIDGNGNASIEMKMRADQPGIVYLNGNPMKMPPLMFKIPEQGFGF